MQHDTYVLNVTTDLLMIEYLYEYEHTLYTWDDTFSAWRRVR